MDSEQAIDVLPSRQPSLWFTRPGRIALLATLIAATPFLLFGFGQLVKTAAWVSQRIEAPGTVREVVRDEETGRYYVVADFTTSQGRTQPFARWIGGPDDYRQGQVVRVMYRDSYPEVSARIVTWKGLWFEPLFRIALALLTLLVGLSVFVVTEVRIGKRAARTVAATPPRPARVRNVGRGG